MNRSSNKSFKGNMKLALGAKFAILIAFVVSALWFVLFFAGDSLGGGFQEFGGLLIDLLSFPLGWLSGMFSHTDAGPKSEIWMYLILMIPNCFLSGYSLAGLAWVFGLRSRRKATS